MLQPSRLAIFGAIGAGLSVVALLVAQARSPGHDPASHFISELALGETAPLFAASFWVLAPSILAIAAAFHLSLPASRARRLGVRLLCVAAVGVFIMPLFPMSPPNGHTTPETVVHGTIAASAFISLNAGVILLTRAVAADPARRQHHQTLAGFALVGTTLLVIFIAMVAIGEMDKTSPVMDILGAVERALIAVNLAWCMAATVAVGGEPLTTGRPSTGSVEESRKEPKAVPTRE